EILSNNFYALSGLRAPEATQGEEMNLHLLNQLPKVTVRLESVHSKEGSEGLTRVKVQNPSGRIAFFIRLKVVKDKDGEEILPVLWEDNYFSLLPGEERQLTARYALADLQNGAARVQVEGWNLDARKDAQGFLK